MTVALPTGGIREAEPRFVDRGSVLKAALGGDDQRLDRLGSKFACSFQTKPMKAEDARIWIARLIRGKREKASVKFPQPGLTNAFTLDAMLNGAHASNAETVTIVINSSQNGKILKEGQFISILASDTGIRYLHQATANATVAGTALLVGVQPPLRRAFTNGSVVTLINPVIEGYVTGDDVTWTVDHGKIYGFSFDIEEAA